MGPMWCFWAFVMERFCGSLVPAVKSRKYPFTSLAHRIRDVAQLSQIKLLYGLTAELDLSAGKEMVDTGLVLDDCEFLLSAAPQLPDNSFPPRLGSLYGVSTSDNGNRFAFTQQDCRLSGHKL